MVDLRIILTTQTPVKKAKFRQYTKYKFHSSFVDPRATCHAALKLNCNNGKQILPF